MPSPTSGTLSRAIAEGVAAASSTARAAQSSHAAAAAATGSVGLRAVYYILYHVYAIGISLLAFFSITIPRTAFAILHWSGGSATIVAGA